MIIWIYVMLAGLAMDILGVWILAEPILKIDLRNKSTLEQKTAETIKEYQRVKGQKSGHLDSELPTWSAFAHLEAIVFQSYLKALNENIKNRKKALVALTIITIGFILQFIANFLQAFLDKI